MNYQLILTKNNFRGGESLTGTLSWTDVLTPTTTELRLYWWTEGKGTMDVGVAARLTLECSNQQGQQPFSFIAPHEPVSCSGSLLSIRWGLELVALPKQERLTEANVIISYDGEEIPLADNNNAT
jgi:hypothetical protein